MKLLDIYEQLQGDLKIIEEELAVSLETSQDRLNQSSGHLLEAGGKRIRPLFVLLSGHFGQYDIHRLKRVAVPLELIHMATLVHDDVIDDAETRRGRKTVKAQWDNRVAMYTGDYIFARSLQVVTEIEDPAVHRILSRSILDMCRGEIEQVRDFYDASPSVRRYFRRIKRKTALLMAVSCQLGGLVSRAEDWIVRNLYLYGYYVGMAFQITDDVLDFIGDESVLGKPAGSDLRQGNVTLPVIYALRTSEEGRDRILTYLQSGGRKIPLSIVLDIVRSSGGIDYSLNLAERYLEKALSVLHRLPSCEARDSLERIARFVGSRSY
jgi:heptaprenyl diphosphate synthase